MSGEDKREMDSQAVSNREDNEKGDEDPGGKLEVPWVASRDVQGRVRVRKGHSSQVPVRQKPSELRQNDQHKRARARERQRSKKLTFSKFMSQV